MTRTHALITDRRRRILCTARNLGTLVARHCKAFEVQARVPVSVVQADKVVRELGLQVEISHG